MMKKLPWILLLAVPLLLILLIPLASNHPDGLARVADDQGFIERAARTPFQVITGYLFPGVGNETVARILAGLVGVIAVFLLVWGVERLVKGRANRET